MPDGHNFGVGDTYDRAEQTLRECVIHVARGCRSTGSHNPAIYESTIAAVLVGMRQAATDHAEALASAASSQWMARAGDAEANMALTAADTSYADLRQEIEFLRSTVEHERERWSRQGMYHGPKTLSEVAETFGRIAAAIPGEFSWNPLSLLARLIKPNMCDAKITLISSYQSASRLGPGGQVIAGKTSEVTCGKRPGHQGEHGSWGRISKWRSAVANRIYP